MKTKTFLIIVGIIVGLLLMSYFMFPVVMMLIKAIFTLNVLIIMGIGGFIGYLIAKILK